MIELNELYRDVILEHKRNPRNYGRLDPHDASAVGHNPLCGDSLSLTLRLDGDAISELRFTGEGCAISVASASLMSEAVKGKPLPEVDALYREVHALLTEAGHEPSPSLGKLQALSGVREFPARVKCASLCWHTLHAALERRAAGEAPAPVSTE
jgi:nitrogen fixation protein NifU and related proteins